MLYKEMAALMFDNLSELKDSTLINEKEYMPIWKEIANLKRVPLNNFT